MQKNTKVKGRLHSQNGAVFEKYFHKFYIKPAQRPSHQHRDQSRRLLAVDLDEAVRPGGTDIGIAVEEPRDDRFPIRADCLPI